MSDSSSAVNPTAPQFYKDRSTGLMVFGIFTILLGAFCGLAVPLMLLSQLIAPVQARTSFSTLLPGISMYAVLAVALIWLGIGSISARRWARALLLVFSWSWLVMGVFMIAIMAFVLPKVMFNLPQMANQPGMPPMHPLPSAVIGVMVAVTIGIDSVIFIVIPAVWTYFYNSRHVLATCAARNPVPCWTDACPLPVLGVCAWLLFAVPMLLVMPLGGHPVMPLFGIFVTGLPAAALYFVLAVIWTLAAWLFYKLDVRGWWFLLFAIVVSMVSGTVTYAQHDMLEMYRLMGYPEAQIEQIRKTGLLDGNWLGWTMPVFMMPIVGYLVYIKKYFRARS